MTNEEGAYTHPGNAGDQNEVTPHVIVSPTYKDPINGALYVHRDLGLEREPYEDDWYIPPVRADVQVGNVQSWAKYVSRYGGPGDDLRDL